MIAGGAERLATILIVDDKQLNRSVLELFLAAGGYLTRSVASGREAIDSLDISVPDLILLDVVMPDMDGFQVAKLLKANSATRNVPIIMVTAHNERVHKLKGLAAGVEEFLTKPVDRTELLLRVRNLLRSTAFTAFILQHHDLLEKEVALRTVDLRRFRTALDATADAILLVNRDKMRFIEVNATACRMFGYTREELFEMGPEQLHARSHSAVFEAYRAMIDNGHGTDHLIEATLQRKDGSTINVEIYRQALQSEDEWIIVAVVHDISERKKSQKHIDQLSHYDRGTGLPNRSMFRETLARTVASADAKHWRLAIVLIDLDHFKSVNDAIGHIEGDEVLAAVGQRLINCVRVRDTVSRFGGDEFALLLLVPSGQRDAVAVARKILSTLLEPFRHGGRQLSLTASIGISMFPDDGHDAETLIKHADTAMHRAKNGGRNDFRFFTPKMNLEMMTRLDLEEALRQAVELQQFKLQYQPKICLKDGKVSGAEALLRWDRPGHGPVSPAVFVPVLEDMGLIARVGNWVVQQACRQIARWQTSPVGGVAVSVNVSSKQFDSIHLDIELAAALKAHGVPAALLELELTESLLMQNTERTLLSLRSIKRLGLDISIDDFGTGYSSLAYLRRFPIDKLKIDIAFIRDVTRSEDDAVMALTILRMAQSLRLKVIAEGVETKEQLEFLRRHGCDEVQGYFFAHPMEPDAFATFVSERHQARATA